MSIDPNPEQWLTASLEDCLKQIQKELPHFDPESSNAYLLEQLLDLCASHGMTARFEVSQGIHTVQVAGWDAEGKTRNLAFVRALNYHLAKDGYHRNHKGELRNP